MHTNSVIIPCYDCRTCIACFNYSVWQRKHIYLSPTQLFLRARKWCYSTWGFIATFSHYWYHCGHFGCHGTAGHSWIGLCGLSYQKVSIHYQKVEYMLNISILSYVQMCIYSLVLLQ